MSGAIERLKDRIRAMGNPFVISILKHSPKYLGASAFSGVVALVMTKYYTHVFDPATYGVLALYITLFTYMQNLIAFSVDSSSQRVYFDYTGQERRPFLGTTLIFMAASSLFWVVVTLAIGPLLVGFMGGDLRVLWATLALSIVYMFANFLIRIAYSEHRSSLVARQGVLQTAMNHAASVFFIAVGKLGILGYQLGSLLSYGVTGLLYRKELKSEGFLNVEWTFRKDIMRRLLYFSVPAFFTAAIATSLSYLDRVFLQYFHGAGEVGIYSLGYTLGQGMSLGIEAVSLAIFPSLMRELDDDYDVAIHKLKRFDLYFWAGLLAVAVGISVLRYPIIQLFSNNRYAASANVLPIIAMTFVLGGFYKIASQLLSYHNIVRFYPALTVFAFGVNAALNWLLIPRFHELGAAYATFIGVLLYSSAIHLIARKCYFKASRVLAVYGTIYIVVTVMFLVFTGVL